MTEENPLTVMDVDIESPEVTVWSSILNVTACAGLAIHRSDATVNLVKSLPIEVIRLNLVES